MKTRYEWFADDPPYAGYHDHGCRVPDYDARDLLIKLNLDGAQAGLSRIKNLKKRVNYYPSIGNFDHIIIAANNGISCCINAGFWHYPKSGQDQGGD